MAIRPSNRISLIGLVAALSLLLGGCGGGGATIRSSNATCGQELGDLQKAKDSGLLSEREFERTRKAIVERCRKSR